MKKFILAAVLAAAALPVFAQQSFFISQGQTIRNRDIADGYCLEYSQKTISNDNIAGLLNNIEGVVRVIYTDAGRSPEYLRLQDLVNDKQVYFNAFDSYRYLQFFFAEDSGIEALVTGEDGIGFIRNRISADDEKLARENKNKIIVMEEQGLLHHAIQVLIWRTLFPVDRTAEGVRTIDFKTTSDTAMQVRTRFGGGATVDYGRDGRKFMRLDGILNSTDDFSPEITELVSHFHNDHISHAALENLLNEKGFARLFAPYAEREDSRNETFGLLLDIIAGNPDYNSKLENRLLEITGGETPLTPARIGSMGDFYYSAFVYDGDIRLDVFKYKNPKNPNTDGAVYQITHKNVGFLLFGDFDDPAAIQNLLETSEENGKKRAELAERLSDLTKQLYQFGQQAMVVQEVLNLSPLLGIDESSPDSYEARVLRDVLRSRVEELNAMIRKLRSEIASLPTIQADIVKWPHHAHIFREAGSREALVKLNEVVAPRYFIYQVHSAQDLKDFKDYIEGFDFKDKFVNSGEQPVEFISMERLRTRLGSLFAARQREAS
jgi:hypothetical protein